MSIEQNKHLIYYHSGSEGQLEDILQANKLGISKHERQISIAILTCKTLF